MGALEQPKVGIPFKWNHYLFTIKKITGITEAELIERQQIANHLYESGDSRISLFMPTIDGVMVAEWEAERYCLLVNHEYSGMAERNHGYELADFHYRGKFITEPIVKINRTGLWKILWERRLKQVEKVWNERMSQLPESDFERSFLESFPYFMGLTENAIQYLTDTEIDDKPQLVDGGTVCHERFTVKTWGKNDVVKDPFDWVFDHRSRDLAEWIRSSYFLNTENMVQELYPFLAGYNALDPLSSFAWRLLYARLIFPLPYFECVENYYLATSIREKKQEEALFHELLGQTDTYEQLLKYFFEMAQVPTDQLQIPSLDWLSS